MRHTASVVAVNDPVSISETGEAAIEVLTDLPDHRCSAIYLASGSPHPEVGAVITWGRFRAWYGGIVARMVEYAFDPSAPLR